MGTNDKRRPTTAAEVRRIEEDLDVRPCEDLDALHSPPDGTVCLQRRLGYERFASPGEHWVRPALALALTEAEKPIQAQRFPDIWAADLGVWRRLQEHEAPSGVLESWLRSPGRHLALDPTALRDFGANRHDKSSEPTISAIERAAGLDPVDDSELPRGFLELHGDLLDPSDWQPVGRPVERRALGLLLNGTLPSIRGAALTWLMDRAVSHPGHKVNGVYAHLRKNELPVALASTLGAGAESRWYDAAWTSLEWGLLLHAHRVTGEPLLSRRNARVARWMFGVLRRSPFHPREPGHLAAQVLQLLEPQDFPWSVGTQSTGRGRPAKTSRQGLPQLCLLSALNRHYEGKPTLQPTPPTLVTELRRMSELPGTDRPIDLEYHSSAFLGAELPHTSPRLLARRLMTKVGIDWLHGTPDSLRASILDECLQGLLRQPELFEWVGAAYANAAPTLDEETRRLALPLWERVSASELPSLDLASATAAMVPGFIELLPHNEWGHALDLVVEYAEQQRSQALGAIAQSAKRHGLDDLWREALERLMSLVRGAEEVSCRGEPQEDERVDAAMQVLEQTKKSSQPDSDRYLHELDDWSGTVSSRKVRPLTKELARLGIAKK